MSGYGVQSGIGQQDEVFSTASANLNTSRRRISMGGEDEEDDFEQLKRDALQQLTLSQRKRKLVLPGDEKEAVVIDISKLGQRTDSARQHRERIVDKALATKDQDNERLYTKLKQRFDRAGVKLPNVEVRFDNLSADSEVYVGNRALPSILNSYRNIVEGAIQKVGLLRGQKRPFTILKNVSGVLKPGRLTLLLGPPGSGKSTFLKALAGQLQGSKQLRLTGDITYNGERFDAFVAQRTAAYISQVDNHIAELTVRETLDFAARCQGAAQNVEALDQLVEREKELGIQPDIEIDAFMKAMAVSGKRHSIATEYTMRLLGLDVCADTIVGNNVIRGISGGQRKRVTTGEMVVGPKKALFMDEISTGLDSSTTFQIVKCLRNLTHLQQATVLVALLQPAPETFELFDDIMLLSEGHTVFFGPREEVMPFFESQGFRLPKRKGIADFLQEVTSRKDQEQYLADKSKPYSFVPVQRFADAYQESQAGQANRAALRAPYDKQQCYGDALVRTKYALPAFKAFKACLSRDWILIKRHGFLYVFRTCQVAFVAFVVSTLFFRTTLETLSLANANIYLGVTFFSTVHMLFNGYSEMSITVGTLPGFYKHRANLFFPAWAGSLPTALLRLPYSFVESMVYSCMVYWVAGFAIDAGRFFTFWLILFLVHQMAVSLFRLMGAIGRTLVAATTLGSLLLLVVIVLGGFVLIKPDIPPWWIWGFWISPLMYAQQAIAINEFTAARWSFPAPYAPGETMGQFALRNRGLFTQYYWVWLGVGVLVAYAFLFNIFVLLAQSYLGPLSSGAQGMMPEEQLIEREANRIGEAEAAKALDKRSGSVRTDKSASGPHSSRRFSFNPIRSFRQRTGDSPNADSASSSLSDIEMGQAQGSGAAAESNPAESMRAIKGVKREGGMILPFQPLAMTFHDVWYSVDLPKGAQAAPSDQREGKGKPQLMLLKAISGAFQPGILTALVGVSGAGKTTLMDVLAGRKTGGTITGDIRVGGHPKEQASFARISGYVEQNDIHSPQVTVHQSLLFSARLRLQDVDKPTVGRFVEEVMELVELTPLRNALVGLPGVSGLSVEQRKRLTIAVELVANPSIIFMDEPTTGLDARAAAIVMRTVRNTVNTGRTVVCTIHQPSIDIFEAFDDLLLMKRGGRVTYAGSLGDRSCKLIEYFEAIQGVPKIREGLNPATWMLEVSTLNMESKLGVDFADIYQNSDLARRNHELIQRLSEERGEKLHFDSQYPTSFLTQTGLILKKNFQTYWRSPQYNTVRFSFTVLVGLLIGSIYWRRGLKRASYADVLNVTGALFVTTIFLGTSNASTVQPVVAVERSVMYRERAAGMYGAFPYAIAQGLVELPYVLIQTIMYTAITYFMIHFEYDAAKLFWYLLFEYLTLLYFTLYGIAAVAVTPNVQLAAVISSFFYSLWFLFAGFIIPRPRMPGWWVWYYFLDPVSFTVYGLIESQLGDVTSSSITQPGSAPQLVKDFVHSYFGFKHSFLGYDVLVLCGFCAALWVGAAAAFRILNFNKR
ncbi:hypothetical protein WJX72_004056 [[Myrmecia] bisecta]|uniref:ABC transporter domain-containing protein n=1 Tax=[Myrmecia] bisecta TaxID=41462 RepID=A0AAW1Q8M2_9CHLO